MPPIINRKPNEIKPWWKPPLWTGTKFRVRGGNQGNSISDEWIALTAAQCPPAGDMVRAATLAAGP